MEYSFSAVRSIVIFAEDGEGVPSFGFFSALTGLRLTHITSRFGDKVALLEAFYSLGAVEVAGTTIEGSIFTSPSSFLVSWWQERISAAFSTLHNQILFIAPKSFLPTFSCFSNHSKQWQNFMHNIVLASVHGATQGMTTWRIHVS